jgi:branched-chain amino acid transport system permease protein
MILKLVRLALPPVVFVGALLMPWLGSRYNTYIAQQIVIYALFGLSLNMLVGLSGMMSFGHVAYFGIGAYACALLMKSLALPFILAFPLAGIIAGLAALVFGYFCVRLTTIYFAMLTLAFSQIAWAICLKWTEVTGGEQGVTNIPYPDLDFLRAVPALHGLRISELFYLLTVVIAGVLVVVIHRIVRSPFGRVMTAIRENRERAAFIGINVCGYEIAAFVLAGVIGGLSGALFAVFNRGVYPDNLYWTRSADVLIANILGGIEFFWGPVVGAAVITLINKEVTTYTQYWPLLLGLILIVVLFIAPNGIIGVLQTAARKLAGLGHPRGHPRPAPGHKEA